MIHHRHQSATIEKMMTVNFVSNNQHNIVIHSDKRFTHPSRTSDPHYTWLVFKEERWQPFDRANQIKLEQTLSTEGTFVDISDSLFPGVRKVRVFPRNNYLSYLGLKYRLSRVLQPDAWSWLP